MKLYTAPGCGSALIEIALDWCALRYERVELSFAVVAAANHEELLAANPLHQVPTLVLDNGSVMTESAAIVIWLDELYPAAGLLPPMGSAERAHALRWLLFMVTTLYPTFTYADFPERHLSDDSARSELVSSQQTQRKRHWRLLDRSAMAPWFCGDLPSMLDVYIGVMSRWHPRRPWFTQNAPRLYAIAQRVDELPQVRPMMTRNFPA